MQKRLDEKKAESECLPGKDVSLLCQDNSDFLGIDTKDVLWAHEDGEIKPSPLVNGSAGDSEGNAKKIAYTEGTNTAPEPKERGTAAPNHFWSNPEKARAGIDKDKGKVTQPQP